MPIAFVAGATGYTGRALLAALSPSAGYRGGWTARPQARRAGQLQGAAVCDPRDVAALTAAVRGCDAIVQLIGTVRARFADGDYDAIDYGTTVALGQAAEAAGVPRFLLLSSVGADSGRGSYLATKLKTERWLTSRPLEYTILRPSAIVGAGRRGIQILSSLAWPSATYRQIEVNDLARAFVHALERREQVKNAVIEGKRLWELVR